jgi:hypothetical protein
VNSARHHSFAGAGLAEEENGRVLGRHLLNLEEHLLKGIASPYDLAEVEFPIDILLQIDTLSLEPVF